MSENAIVVQTSSAYLAPVADVMTARMRYQGMKDFVSSIMVQGVDFGAVPGTDKPTLLKPGAEKLSSFFGLSPMFTVTEKITDWTGAEHNNEPLFYYSYRCDLMKNGVVVGQGEGSANTWEKKYRWRNSDLLCPECGKDAIKRSKYPPRNNPKAQPGWYCYSKAGGCGAEFSADDKRITEQPRGKIANPDVFDIINTVQKMAQKRALVAAVLIAVNASEYFTQDVEDFIDASWEPTPPPTAHQTTDRPTPEPTPVAVQAAAVYNAPAPMPVVTYEQACLIRNSAGAPYGTMDSAKLEWMQRSIEKRGKTEGVKLAEKDDLRLRYAAIDVILAHRQDEQRAEMAQEAADEAAREPDQEH